MVGGCGGGLLCMPVLGVNIMEEERGGGPEGEEDRPPAPAAAAAVAVAVVWEREGMSFAEWEVYIRDGDVDWAGSGKEEKVWL